jgi:hypothetical protein
MVTKLIMGWVAKPGWDVRLRRKGMGGEVETVEGSVSLKVHKIEIFFGFDFEICIISLIVMSKY